MQKYVGPQRLAEKKGNVDWQFLVYPVCLVVSRSTTNSVINVMNLGLGLPLQAGICPCNGPFNKNKQLLLLAKFQAIALNHTNQSKWKANACFYYTAQWLNYFMINVFLINCSIKNLQLTQPIIRLQLGCVLRAEQSKQDFYCD